MSIIYSFYLTVIRICRVRGRRNDQSWILLRPTTRRSYLRLENVYYSIQRHILQGSEEANTHLLFKMHRRICQSGQQHRKKK